MNIVQGDLLEQVTSGIIAHQVNCQNAMGSGFAKAFYNRYPKIKQQYHALCHTVPKNKRLGTVQFVPLTPELTGVNLFTQFNYGNSQRSGICYTNMDLLIAKLKELDAAQNKPIYAPYRIGCGLAGGDWDKVENALKDTNITFYKL